MRFLNVSVHLKVLRVAARRLANRQAGLNAGSSRAGVARCLPHLYTNRLAASITERHRGAFPTALPSLNYSLLTASNSNVKTSQHRHDRLRLYGPGAFECVSEGESLF